MAIGPIIAAVAIGASSAATGISKGVQAKRQRAAERQAGKLKEEAKTATEARLAALGAQAAGTAIKGQGGDGSLLTGAGGIKDPAITGKKTLLGAQ